jgi:hypothetical protein
MDLCAAAVQTCWPGRVGAPAAAAVVDQMPCQCLTNDMEQPLHLPSLLLLQLVTTQGFCDHTELKGTRGFCAFSPAPCSCWYGGVALIGLMSTPCGSTDRLHFLPPLADATAVAAGMSGVVPGEGVAGVVPGRPPAPPSADEGPGEGVAGVWAPAMLMYTCKRGVQGQ